jgi:TIR domain
MKLLGTNSGRDRIFISYRRSDTRGYAGRLDDTLKGYFGKDRVFRDVGGIEAGEDFVRKIDAAMGDAGALIVLIGANWLAPGEDGKPRLHGVGDHVAAEIEAALVGNHAIFPVLVEGASMPREQDLPERLRALARRNALTLTDERWNFDATRLAKMLALDIAGSVVERRLDLLKTVVLALLFVSTVFTTLHFTQASYCAAVSQAAEEGGESWRSFLCRKIPSQTPARDVLVSFFSASVASVNFVCLLIATLALAAARTWVEPGRRRFIWATVFLGVIGTLAAFIFYNLKTGDQPALAVSAMFAASSLLIFAMLVLMNLSGFKPNDSVI